MSFVVDLETFDGFFLIGLDQVNKGMSQTPELYYRLKGATRTRSQRLPSFELPPE